MRKSVLIGLMLVAAACHHSTHEDVVTGVTPTTAPAGASARSALDEFMAAVRTQDLVAVTGVG